MRLHTYFMAHAYPIIHAACLQPVPCPRPHLSLLSSTSTSRRAASSSSGSCGPLPQAVPSHLRAGYGKTRALPYSDNNMRAELLRAVVEHASQRNNDTIILISPSMSGWVICRRALLFLLLPDTRLPTRVDALACAHMLA